MCVWDGGNNIKIDKSISAYYVHQDLKISSERTHHRYGEEE